MERFRPLIDTQFPSLIRNSGILWICVAKPWLDRQTSLPDWLQERTATLKQWRSAARFAALAIHWRGQRFAGDETIYEAIESWRKQDKHLYEWQANQRAGMIRWRDHFYREFAAKLRSRYKTVAIEATNWAKLQRLPQPEEKVDGGLREHQRIASVGRLCQLLREMMPAFERVDAAWTTQRCHKCQKLSAFDSAAQLSNTCRHCGETWDQDRNAAMNLLAASVEVVDETPAVAR